jgi:hypothetical protein
MTGRLNATGTLEMPPEGMRLADGNFDISCKNCVVGDGKAKVKAAFVQVPNNPGSAAWAKEGFTLPPLSLGQFSGGVDIKKGKRFQGHRVRARIGEAESQDSSPSVIPQDLEYQLVFQVSILRLRSRKPTPPGGDRTVAANLRKANYDGSSGVDGGSTGLHALYTRQGRESRIFPIATTSPAREGTRVSTQGQRRDADKENRRSHGFRAVVRPPQTRG